MISIGDTAPLFVAKSTHGDINLENMKGGWVVLYFYPKDNTPGCSTQAMDFTASKKKFEKLNCTIFGISPDSVEKHHKFTEQKELNITLLSDEDHTIAQSYGAWRLKKNFGKEYMGIVRTTYLIDPKGVVAYIWNSVKVRQKRQKDGKQYEVLHIDKVLEKLQKLQDI
ncbi:MAG: peroxiredoxin [Campylobacteraceae bacterium 4484_166]|nr:MAG: peroxiredoxin [Campylobacteraceae bacterium 4484_166]